MHQIQIKYNQMKALFGASPINPAITDIFYEINNLCQIEIDRMRRLPLTSNATARGKNYIVFAPDGGGKQSRPVNLDLYSEGSALDHEGNSKIEVFWANVRNQSIANQSARDITTALYVIAMNYCCCADLVDGMKRNAGDYFEKLITNLCNSNSFTK